MAVQVGQPAPDFVDVKLSDHRGKWVVLFSYPLDFTFVCPTEIQGFAKHNEEFEKLGALTSAPSRSRSSAISAVKRRTPTGCSCPKASRSVGRNTDETLRVLQALQTGELCPVDWRPGQATLS